jgi:hypothetical protein
MQQPPAEMHPAVEASSSAAPPAADATQAPARAVAAAAAPDPSSRPAEAPMPAPEGSDPPPPPAQKTVTWSEKLTSDSPTHAQAAAESSQYVSRGPASSSSKGKNLTDSARLDFGLAPVPGRLFFLSCFDFRSGSGEPQAPWRQ